MTSNRDDDIGKERRPIQADIPMCPVCYRELIPPLLEGTDSGYVCNVCEWTTSEDEDEDEVYWGYYPATDSEVVTELVEWVLERWDAEVLHRPQRNVYRNVIDSVWRQVYRRLTGEDMPRPESIKGESDD